MSDILRALAHSQRIVVTSHANPDPDAYASSVALAVGLRKLGKDVVCVNHSGLLPHLAYLPLVSEVRTDSPLSHPDLLVVTDCAALPLIGREINELCSTPPPIMNLDHHHLSNKGYGTYNLVSPEVSCASELAYIILRGLGVEIDSDLATLLLAGIYNDTLSLQKLVSSPETLQVVKELLACGGNLERFVDTMYRENSIELLRLKGEIFSQITTRCQGRYLPIVLDLAALAQRNLTEHDLAPLKNLPMEVSGVVIGAVIRVDGDLCKVSLRSKGTFDVRAIAEQFSGQGHLNASGFAYQGSVTELLPRLEEAVQGKMVAPLSLALE
jgi:phosphoesterase RecJ-like protein